MKYTITMTHGISEENYAGTPFEPLFGTGQGSGASPAIWLTLVVILMDTLDRVIPERITFHSPDSEMVHSCLIDAFVDDTSVGFTDPGFLSLKTMVSKLSNIAQTWEKLLFYSGGALNLKKCSWYIMHWDWKKGRPHMQRITEGDPTLSMTTQGENNSQSIKRLELSTASRILGVYLSPNGDFSEQLQVLKSKADTFAIRLRSPRLHPQDILTFHSTMYAPAMRYVLPALAVDEEEELSKIQATILPAMLNKLGFSCTTPTAIRHGPKEMGGIDLIDLRTEMGISQLKLFRDSVYSGNEVGNTMILNIKYMQLESGLAEPLMEHPDIHISYLTPTWTTSLRQFMYQHNLTTTLTDTMTVQFRGKFDQCIMNQTALAHYSPSQKKDINLVRLHLQVITLADVH